MSGVVPVGNTSVGPGGQFGYGQNPNGKYDPFREFGIGKPGGPSLSIYYAFAPGTITNIVNTLGGRFQYITTPSTIAISPITQVSATHTSAYPQFSSSGSFSGGQIQALQGVAGAFGESTLTGSQIQAALAVKAAFSSK
jgi:hypothetical protein